MPRGHVVGQTICTHKQGLPEKKGGGDKVTRNKLGKLPNVESATLSKNLGKSKKQNLTGKKKKEGRA